MAMTVGRTWPGRPRPRPDEIFSSWFVRVAVANGLTAAELYRLIVPKGFARFHSDLDRVVGSDLVEALSAGTGVEPAAVWSTTLVDWSERAFELEDGIWMPSVRVDHSRPTFSQQYCPLCLAEDEVPIFRRAWRLKFVVACERHNVFLADRCPKCGKSIRPLKTVRIRNRLLCPDCEAVITAWHAQPASGLDHQRRLLEVVERGFTDHPGIGRMTAVDWFNLLGASYRLIAGGMWASKLRRGIALTEPRLAPVLDIASRLNINTLSASERHPLLQAALWLVDEWPRRFFGTCQMAGVTQITLANIWPYRTDGPSYAVVNRKMP